VGKLTFTAFKKLLKPGDELYCTRNHSGPCRLLRIVDTVQTNAMTYTGDGVDVAKYKHAWTHWPKTAKDFEALDNGFRIWMGEGEDRRYIEYEFKKVAALNAENVEVAA
jgi:hypothetical protein